MNYGISILFRAIPLAMALFCFGYGAFIYGYGDDGSRVVAGPVVFSLGMICIALFCTAATIIRQIIHTYNKSAKYVLPVIGYLAAIITIIGGICIFSNATSTSAFVAGHVITGVGFITTCVATAATSSTRFSLIPRNSKATSNEVPEGAYNIRANGQSVERNSTEHIQITSKDQAAFLKSIVYYCANVPSYNTMLVCFRFWNCIDHTIYLLFFDVTVTI